MGKKAIWQPMTITEPGYYFLSEDIEVAIPTQPVITIQARNVTLDLNGHTIKAGDTEPAIVFIDEGAGNTTIKNGNINGDEGSAITSHAGLQKTIRIESIHFSGCGCGISIDTAEEIDIMDCTFNYGGCNPILELNMKDKSFRGRLINNKITNVALPSAIIVNGMQNGEIRGNLVEKYGSPGYPGSGAGLLMTGRSIGNVIRQNIFNRGGKKVPGIQVNGAYNLIEGNQITGNGGPGILFSRGSAHNAFRLNMLRGNTEGPFVDLGTDNTDEGGNIF